MLHVLVSQARSRLQFSSCSALLPLAARVISRDARDSMMLVATLNSPGTPDARQVEPDRC